MGEAGGHRDRAGRIRREPRRGRTTRCGGIILDSDDLPTGPGLPMDTRIAPLSVILELNTRLFRNCLEGMDDDAGARRIDDRTNPPSFVAAHLLDARAYLARLLGLDAAHPYREELAGVGHVDELERLPPLAGILEAWDDLSDRLLSSLEEVDAETLEAPAGQPFPVDDARLLGALAFLVQHESYHIGQLALLRKHAGLPAMTYE